MSGRRIQLVSLLAVLVAACGCAGDGSDLVDDVMNGGETATLAYIQVNIFSPICARCHFPGGIGPMPLDSEAASFQSLVNVPSIELQQLLRVEPGNPDDSYLVWKIEGRQGILGARMPLGLPPLAPDEIDSIIRWIENGARP